MFTLSLHLGTVDDDDDVSKLARITPIPETRVSDGR